MKLSLVVCLIFIKTFLFGQTKEVSVHFIPLLQGKNLVMEQYYPIGDGTDSLQIETFQFYLSHIEFRNDTRLVPSTLPEILLIDLQEPSSQHIVGSLAKYQPFNTLHFMLGIDSLTNVSGVFGGVLDPTNGLYWTWQSGYINCKLEGKSTICATRNNQFTFHLGGYENPYASIQEVNLTVTDQDDLVIELPLDDFFDQINLNKVTKIMHPCKEAVELSELLANQFQLEP
jgi:hypothetical protein